MRSDLGEIRLCTSAFVARRHVSGFVVDHGGEGETTDPLIEEPGDKVGRRERFRRSVDPDENIDWPAVSARADWRTTAPLVSASPRARPGSPVVPAPHQGGATDRERVRVDPSRTRSQRR